MSGIDAKSDAIFELVEEGSAVEQLATGFTFTEGPIWHPAEQVLYFSDMPGDVRRKVTLDGQVTEVRRPSFKCNGMTLEANLDLLVCEHVTSSLVRERRDGVRETLAFHYEGKYLNSPNDVTVRSDGTIYFSDPWYGRFPGFGIERGRELGWQGVFRIPPGGGQDELELAVAQDEFDMPNGLCFSPDESLLYINDTPRAHIKVFDVAGDGSLSNGRMFFDGVGTGVIEEGIPDGMKCDERGNIWVTGPGGVWVISPQGEHLGTVLVPGERRQPDLGRARLAHAVHPLEHVRVHDPDNGRPTARALHELGGGDEMPDYSLDASRCVLIVQDMQNDVIIDGGAFAESGSPQHAKDQNVVENVKDLAAFCRGKGIPVIHVWYIVDEGAPGLKVNAPLFEGVAAGALVRGTWGAEPAEGLEAQDGDFVVEKMRMSAWQGTKLENLLAGLGRDTIVVTGAWTNMSIEHTSRTGADKGFFMVVPEDGCSTMNADWHNASINFALQNVSTVTNCADVKAALA